VIGSNFGSVDLMFSLKLSIYYRNQLLSCWEPLIEPLHTELIFTSYLSDLLALPAHAITACAIHGDHEEEEGFKANVTLRGADWRTNTDVINVGSSVKLVLNFKNNLEVSVFSTNNSL
jgi:hypothetical protein